MSGEAGETDEPGITAVAWFNAIGLIGETSALTETGCCGDVGRLCGGGVIGMPGSACTDSELIPDSSLACVSPKLRVSDRLRSGRAEGGRLMWPVL